MLAAMLVQLAGTGCTFFSKNQEGKVDLGVEVKSAKYSNSAAIRNTIGAYSVLDGLAQIRVRGYGVVVGLGENGSRNCPKAIYDRVIQDLYKKRQTSGMELGERSISPERLLDDVDTAVVVVEAAVPAGATPGALFDVSVRALPGTDTVSLRGGRLFTTELQTFRRSAAGASLTGKTMAKAKGPIFVNPFASNDSATKVDARLGRILGGGRAIVFRPIRLVLTNQSFVISRRIQDRINAHFPSRHKIADAKSPSLVELGVPREHRESVGHFLALVRSLFLSSGPTFEAVRTRQLVAEMTEPDAPHAKISLALEGIGRNALPSMQAIYASEKEYASFYSAVAGIRLGDHIAADRMALIAKDASSVYRYQAIHALAEAKGMAAAAMALRTMLGDDDPRVQIAVYEALRERHDVSLESVVVGDNSFVLDLIPSASINFIYARRKHERRLALFGKGLRCSPPILYHAPDGIIMLSANLGDQSLKALRRLPLRGQMSPPVDVPLDVQALVELLGADPGVDENGKVNGLNIDYGTVVHLLYQLCKDGAIPADFILEQPNATELFGPSLPRTRPESEL